MEITARPTEALLPGSANEMIRFINLQICTQSFHCNSNELCFIYRTYKRNIILFVRWKETLKFPDSGMKHEQTSSRTSLRVGVKGPSGEKRRDYRNDISYMSCVIPIGDF